VAVVLVEQHVQQALTIADRGCVLRRGRMVLSGTGADLRSDLDSISSHYLAGAL
jgi:branched-chain amino acid transport system ATP-binding protein